jgi:CRP/FNR family cyclic AMP-dependent transcriptional regulator
MAMVSRRFARGAELFREGDAVDCVFRLVSGEVEILRRAGEQAIVLGRVGAGQFLGEMGVIEERARRSATARACTEVAAEILTPSEFFDRLEQSPGTARDLIRRLSQRLHAVEERIVGEEARSEAGPAPGREARIEARTGWLQRQMPAPVTLARLPFIVGRRPLAGERAARRRPDLLLDDYEPFRLSRDHFMIVARNGTCHVRDLGSTLGTVVNGVPVGEHFGRDEVALSPGANEVVAGGADSRFSFLVNVG